MQTEWSLRLTLSVSDMCTDRLYCNRLLQSRIGQIASQLPNYTVPDCRSLVKTLVSGVKTITWGASTCKAPTLDPMFLQNKQFLAKETLVYVRLVHFALRALDIYTINVGPSGQQHVRPAK